MTDRDAHGLGLNSWAECSAHVVQNTPTYAALASSSCGPAVAGAEMPLLNNPVADDLESDPGFVCNCGRMSAFKREYYRLNNIMPISNGRSPILFNEFSQATGSSLRRP